MTTSRFTNRGYSGWSSTTPVTTSDWYFVAVTLSSSTLSFYVDGQLAGSAPGNYSGSGGDYYLGGTPGDACSLDGALDETLVFDTALSPAEISQLYNGGNGTYGVGSLTGLVAGYHYDEGSGGVVHDFSGNGNDGKIVGPGISWGSGKVVEPETVTFATSGLSVGSHAITALYQPNGDSNYAAASSASITETILPTTTTTLSCSSASPVAGQTVTLTAMVNGGTYGTPTGTVDFFDGTTQLGSATLSDGTATLPTTTLPGGGQDLTAVYEGEPLEFAGSTSPRLPRRS